MNEAKEFWDKSAGNYDKTEERFEYIHRTARAKAKKYLKTSDIVLDFGCGTGTVACEFADSVREIHAIDISTGMIELAKKKVAAGNVENVNFMTTDIFDERHKKGSFDVVLAFNMLHTVPDPQKIVQRTHELLKPDGTFISVTPCLRDKMSFAVNAQIQLVRLLSATGIIPIPIRRLKSSELDDLMSGGNFETIDTESIYQGASSYFMAAKKAQESPEV